MVPGTAYIQKTAITYQESILDKTTSLGSEPHATVTAESSLIERHHDNLDDSLLLTRHHHLPKFRLGQM